VRPVFKAHPVHPVLKDPQETTVMVPMDLKVPQAQMVKTDKTVPMA
jgi:hypothetical protein